NENENLRISVKAWQQKPGRHELRSLQVYDTAIHRLLETTPGFSMAWEAALKDAEEQVERSDRGILAFTRRLILPRAASPSQGPVVGKATGEIDDGWTADCGLRRCITRTDAAKSLQLVASVPSLSLMRGDLLSGGLPKKLVCRDGRWSLEVVRQVAIERNVYRPHIQRLEGAEVILGYLRRSTQFQALAEKASGLLAQGETDVRSYEAVNGEWVQSALAPSYIEQLKLQHKAAAQKTHRVQLLEVRAECFRVRHANVRLEAKVNEL